MTPELWQAKKIVDSTLHPGIVLFATMSFSAPFDRLHALPDTGEPVLLPFRMSCFVLSNLVVTAGMLSPGQSTRSALLWQITNQSLNVAINSSNANKSTVLSTAVYLRSYLIAVSASCSVVLGLNALVPRLKMVSPATRTVLTRLVPFAAVASAGALNVFLMRGEEMRQGIDVFPIPTSTQTKVAAAAPGSAPPAPADSFDSKQSLGKSRKAATIAVSETALSRVLNSTPIMVLPPLILVRLQQTAWLRQRPRLVLPLNLGLIFATSVFALPLALGAFPQRQRIRVDRLEKEFTDKLHDPDGEDARGTEVEFNRGI